MEAESTARWEAMDLAPLAETPLRVSVKMGETRLRLRDLLAVEHGSLIVLDEHQTSSVDILANGRVLARGELCVSGDQPAVRVVSLLCGDSTRR